MKFVNEDAIRKCSYNWEMQTPYPHFIVDAFFENNVAANLEREFPSFDSNTWHTYENAIEIKKVCNNWNMFPVLTYQVFAYLNSTEFVDFLSKTLFRATPLYSDPGLNGGGWHIHSRGGKLNTHLDYSIHPKLGKQRKINIIVYLNSKWHPSWGGSLGLWGNASSKEPGQLVKSVESIFNRAVIFDTTFNSWHGLPDPVVCPDDEFRKSLAVYYLTDAPQNGDLRGKALFAPAEHQKGDQKVLDLIKRRSDLALASSVYKASGP